MKNKLLVFLFLAQCAWAQTKPNASVPKADMLYWYRLSYTPDSLATTKRNELMRLYSGRGVSKFISNGNFLFDSLEATVTAPGAKFNGDEYGKKIIEVTQTTPTNFRFQIYKDFSHNLVRYYERVWATMYQYPEEFQTIKWHLTNTTSSVAGYTCQLATTTYAGRSYQAWFTREIPVSEGPYKFCGLPGLIIKVADSRNQYSFELVKIKRLQIGLPLDFPKGNAKQVTKASLRKAREDLKANMPNMFASAAKDITTDDKLQMRANIRKNNNSIELH